MEEKEARLDDNDVYVNDGNDEEAARRTEKNTPSSYCRLSFSMSGSKKDTANTRMLFILVVFIIIIVVIVISFASSFSSSSGVVFFLFSFHFTGVLKMLFNLSRAGEIIEIKKFQYQNFIFNPHKN